LADKKVDIFALYLAQGSGSEESLCLKSRGQQPWVKEWV